VQQVRKLRDAAQFADHLRHLGIEMPFDSSVDPAGPLAQPLELTDGSRGITTVANRWSILPMEGWDGDRSGRPTDLVRRRWERFASSGAGLVWGEATAVRHDGRANPNQLVIDETTVDDLAALRSLLDPAQVTILQLTHSGRYARPDGSPAPRTAYAHPLLDGRVGAGDAEVLTDDEIEELIDAMAAAAALAAQAGFDYVDVKACHGYLGHEFLSAVDRPGPFGGDLEGRTRFFRRTVEEVRRRAPGLGVAIRLSAFDLVPYVSGDDGVGVPERTGGYRHAFGGDGTGLGVDLTETHRLLDIVAAAGVGLVSVSAGSPYYTPHIQRPAFFPPSDGYLPPEDPLVGVARLLTATAELAAAHPGIALVGSGYSYLQEWLAHVAQAVVGSDGAAMVGLGRMALSYPHLPADVAAGRDLDRRLLCRTFSDCTTAPRGGLVSGCYPLDPFYKDRPERVELARMKKEQKEKAGRRSVGGGPTRT
jgi:2,4-dienoyl-CoA reductase-like NADH-dependent reductase (Old Yellow Enzyme family)